MLMKSGRRSAMARREAMVGICFASPWMIGFIFFVLGPVVASLYLSLTEYQILVSPRFTGFDNYANLFANDRLFWTSLYNTAYYTLFVIPLRITLALLLALLLNRSIPGIGIFRTVYYIPSVVSGVVMAVVWGWIFNSQYGLLNSVLEMLGLSGPMWLSDPRWSKPAFVIMGLWGIGTPMVVFLAGLQGIPQHLYEAAMIDGANRWSQFWNVTIPMLSPTIFFNMIMQVISSFQIFTQAYVLTQGGPLDSTLFYVLYLYMNGFRYYKMGYASAMAWVLFAIIFVLTLIQVRHSSWVYYEGGDSNAS